MTNLPFIHVYQSPMYCDPQNKPAEAVGVSIAGRIEFSAPQAGPLPVVNAATLEALLAYLVYMGPVAGVERQAHAFFSVYRGFAAPGLVLDALQRLYDDNTPPACEGKGWAPKRVALRADPADVL
jgi:hypothetical protein